MLEHGIDYVNIESNFISDNEVLDIVSKYEKAISLYGSEGFEDYMSSVHFQSCDEGFINRDSVYMQEEY